MLIPRNQQQVIGFLLAQKKKVEKKKEDLHTFTFFLQKVILADVPKHVLRKRKNSTFLLPSFTGKVLYLDAARL